MHVLKRSNLYNLGRPVLAQVSHEVTLIWINKSNTFKSEKIQGERAAPICRRNVWAKSL